MYGLSEIVLMNAWAVSKECRRITRKAAAQKEQPILPFRLVERSGKTFQVYAQGRMVELR